MKVEGNFQAQKKCRNPCSFPTWETQVSKPISWKMGDFCLKTHLHLSVEAEVFIRRERGPEQRDQGRGLKSSLRAEEHSPFQEGKWWSGVCHPGLVILDLRQSGSTVEGQQISRGWDSWRSDSIFLKVVERILIQICRSSTSYMLVRVRIYRNNVKRMVGWVTIPHCYNFHHYRQNAYVPPKFLCWNITPTAVVLGGGVFGR